MTAALTEFLLARIAEDETMAAAGGAEATVRAWFSNHRPSGGWGASAQAWMDLFAIVRERHDPDRVLAECEAKRRIVERLAWRDKHPEWELADDMGPSWDDADFTLRALAAVYADHSDYRDEWRI